MEVQWCVPLNLWSRLLVQKKTMSWNQNFRSERRRKLSSHQFTSFFIKTRWKLCKHHSLAVWSFFLLLHLKKPYVGIVQHLPAHILFSCFRAHTITHCTTLSQYWLTVQTTTTTTTDASLLLFQQKQLEHCQLPLTSLLAPNSEVNGTHRKVFSSVFKSNFLCWPSCSDAVFSLSLKNL